MTKTKFTALKDTTFIDTIDDLVEKRIRWEQGAYAASNTELYSLLGECLDLFIKIKRSYDLPKGVNMLLDSRSITYNANTSLELKLVRLVFADANTVSKVENRLFTYARVIRVAADAQQSGNTLAKFIADNHGIDEIRRKGKDGVSSAERQKSQVDQARIELLEPSVAELFSNFELPDALQPKDGEHFSLALVRKNPDGTGSIVFGTNNVAAVTSVLSIAGKSLQDEAVKSAVAETEKRTEAIKQKNMATLVTALKATSAKPKSLSARAAKAKSADLITA